MDIGSHEHGQGRVYPQKSKADMEKELVEIREQMEKLAFKMQQEAKVRWRYEWPLKRRSVDLVKYQVGIGDILDC
jgi:hypothetical protein